MINTMIYPSSKIDEKKSIKTLQQLKYGDILKNKKDNLYYVYEKDYNEDANTTRGHGITYSSFYGFIVPKLFLKKFFYKNKDLQK